MIQAFHRSTLSPPLHTLFSGLERSFLNSVSRSSVVPSMMVVLGVRLLMLLQLMMRMVCLLERWGILLRNYIKVRFG
jgi:hypothetical protein